MLFSSCDDDDGYSLDNYAITIGTFMSTGEYYYIETDGGYTLWPSASNISADKHEDGDRIMVNFTILEEGDENDTYDYYVKINSTASILTKAIFNFNEETTQEEKDSIGNDPVTIHDTWFTDDYLNVEFEYGGGYATHFINLVKDSTDLETENGEIILELKHNKNGDPYNYSQWGIVSFDISELKKEGENSVDIFLRSIDSDGQYSYNKVLTYDYSSEESTSQASIGKIIDKSEITDEIYVE